MQEVALRSWQGLLSARKLDSSWCTIECVANHGMLDRAQVHADLMGSARLDRKLEQREAAQGFHDFIQRMRLASMCGSRGHAEAVNAIASDSTLDFSGRLLDSAVYQRQIPFGNRTRLKLACEIRVAEVVPGDHEQSGSLLVQSVHNSRTIRAAGLRQTLEVVQQCINERSLMNSCTNVYHHPGWLIDDRQVGIFINDLQRNGFRDENTRFRFRQGDFDLFFATQLVACLRGLSIQQDLLVVNPSLDLRAALFWKCFAQEAVEALLLVCCFGGQCGHNSNGVKGAARPISSAVLFTSSASFSQRAVALAVLAGGCFK